MKRLSTGELLDIWERYMHHSALERSLYLLSALYGPDVNTIARLSIGERDARLLQFREWVFGTRLINIAECPECSGRAEWEMTTSDIRLQKIRPDEPVRILNFQKDGFEISYRLPDSADLLRALTDPALAGDSGRFISNCIISAQRDKEACAADEIPPEIIADISVQMAAEDPQADIEMAVTCPECGHQWNAPFDIVRYLWTEIDSWAKRVLQEVAILARAFGWGEKEILNLSPQRRQLYLQLAVR